ncbi:MAG: TolC family protein, partial [Deltaproteobacteria bacterium]|nr:TolC family protein [Deltaproteobacteria bacterium]
MISIKNILSRPVFRAILTGFLISAITGCSTNYLTVRKEQAAKFNEDIATRTGQIISPDIKYDLESCINIALENNLDIRIAEINGRLAGIDRKIAFSYFLPNIDVSYTHTEADKLQMRNAGGSYMAMADQDTTVTVIKGQMAVFYPEAWFIYSAFRKGEDIKNLITLRVKQSIRLQVTALYLSCFSLDSSSSAIKASVEQAETLLKEMEALYGEGLILKSDLEKSRVFLLMQRNNLAEIERQKTFARSSLLTAMGLSPLSEIKLGIPPSLSIESRELTDMILTALLNRPELKIADRNVGVKADAIKRAVSAFLPRILLIGDFTRNEDSYLRYRDIFTYGVSGVLTILDGFSNIYEYKAAKQERLKAMLEREQSCMKIMLEVIQAKQS